MDNQITPAAGSFDESASVEVSADRMEAYITFIAAMDGGRELTQDNIVELLDKEGIIPDMELLAAIARNKRYERKMPVARGRAPTPGTDGYLQFHFDRSNLKPKPKIMEDGSVNFKQLDMFRLCNRGDVLVTTVLPRDGVAGVDVFGKAVMPDKTKEAAPIPMGSGTVMSEDGLHLIADESGQLLILEGKINISPQLEIAGNVDNSTGNVTFNGQVVVRGNVTSGFTVKAKGSIEIDGVCEAATIISEKGSIVLGMGAQGGDKAILEAAQDVTAKFIEGCTVTVGGNIMADSILKSKIKCEGTVTLAGKNGLLVGGALVAGQKLVARTIGSPMGTTTEVEVGGNTQDLKRHSELVEEFNTLRQEFDKCDKAVATLNAAKQRDMLDESKKAMLIKMINMKMVYRNKMTKMQDEIDALARQLAVNVGTVSASNVIRPGVKVTIGSAQLLVREDIPNCKLRNNGEKISIGPNV
ncbi:MAG: FapA family protein [Defluviitaleaceae bacterium]|nr:FapA family protein [Defluviitaleaceae bacterium]MCL2275844.1 FapA family protein [Defluviitaleaceae bacterium]